MIEHLPCTALPSIYNHHHPYQNNDENDNDEYDEYDEYGEYDELMSMMMVSPKDESVPILLGLKTDCVCLCQ